METGMRGFLLAGEDGFLDPYRSGQKATYARITALKETVSDNPKQVTRLEEAKRPCTPGKKTSLNRRSSCAVRSATRPP
jgi:CHASE3 domain sensor protein